MDLAARARPVLGLAWYDVRYETLVADFAAETRRICEFLGIEWTGGMSEFASRVQSRAQCHPEHRAAGARPGPVRGRSLAALP